MPLGVADIRSNPQDQIAHAARVIGRSLDCRAVFTAVYEGKKQVKTVSEIAQRTGLVRIRVLQEAGKLSDNDIIEKTKIAKELAYRKYPFYTQNKEKVLRIVDKGYDKRSILTITEPTPVEIGKSYIMPNIAPRYLGSPEIVRPMKMRFLAPSEMPQQANLPFPSASEIPQIAEKKENHIYEFKAAGTDIRNITREIAAFANTTLGGIIFYGISNDGKITGADMCLQEIDQPIQNSVRNTILPSLAVDIEERDIVNCKVILIRVPAWNRRDVYQYDGRVYMRHGTNVFVSKPEETKKLYKGTPVA